MAGRRGDPGEHVPRRRPWSVQPLAPASGSSPGARLGSRPLGRRYSGRIRPGRPAGERPSGSTALTTTAGPASCGHVPGSTAKSCCSSATRHSSGRAASISRWSGISHCSSKRPVQRSGPAPGSGPLLAASRPVRRCGRAAPPPRSAGCATGSARTAARAPAALGPHQRGPSGPAACGASGAITQPPAPAAAGHRPGHQVVEERRVVAHSHHASACSQRASTVTENENRSPR